MIENIHEHMFGTDASNEISLLEYGLLVAPAKVVNPEQSHEDDEYFCVYRVTPDAFDTGYIRISELDKLINGEDWMKQSDIDSFLSTFGISKEDWLQLSPVNKISDMCSLGVENIFGSSYDTVDEDFVRGTYLNDPEGDFMLLVDENRGVYIPQTFAEMYGEHLLNHNESGASLDWSWELETLKKGPDDNEDYYEAMDSIERNGILEIDGKHYDIEQDGDLWAYEHGKRRPNSEN